MSPGDATNVLNYGLAKVRFLAPVPAGTAVVLRVELAAVESKSTGQTPVRCRNTAYAADALDRPLMAAESMGLVTT